VFTNDVLTAIDFTLNTTDGGATLMQTGVLR